MLIFIRYSFMMLLGQFRKNAFWNIICFVFFLVSCYVLKCIIRFLTASGFEAAVLVSTSLLLNSLTAKHGSAFFEWLLSLFLFIFFAFAILLLFANFILKFTRFSNSRDLKIKIKLFSKKSLCILGQVEYTGKVGICPYLLLAGTWPKEGCNRGRGLSAAI